MRVPIRPVGCYERFFSRSGQFRACRMFILTLCNVTHNCSSTAKLQGVWINAGRIELGIACNRLFDDAEPSDVQLLIQREAKMVCQARTAASIAAMSIFFIPIIASNA